MTLRIPDGLAGLLISVLGAVAVWQACARAPHSVPMPQSPTLEAGTWHGTVTPPDRAMFDLSLEVSGERDSLSIMMVTDGGSFPLNDIRLAEDELAFSIPGQRTECVLTLQENGGYSGECIQESVGVARVTIRPPHEIEPERVPDFKAWVWPSEPPDDHPFELSTDILGLAFTGVHSDYHVADTGLAFTGARSDYHLADTWYPSWATNDTLYSPWTDGTTDGMEAWSFDGGPTGRAAAGHGVLIGDDPVNLEIVALGTFPVRPEPYAGRYPSASLVYNGVWYYGTYCLGPSLLVEHEGRLWGWSVLGPMAGFRTSTDFGRTWTASPHSCADGLFPEPAEHLGPVKMGVPHFVDFGRNMEHSPDGKAYLVATGAEADDPYPRFANLSWITGDQIYLARVTPSLQNINDVSQYEFFAGHTDAGEPIWTSTFSEIQPIVDWNNNAGNAAITYNAPLKKYLLSVTDGWPTTAKMNSYILESDRITGPYKLVTYMRDFGEQAYFLNFPSKFISEDGRTAWLCYSSNWTSTAPEVFGVKLEEDPPGSHYGLVLQEVWLLDEQMLKRTGPRGK